MIKAEPCLTRYPTNEVGAHPFTLQTLCHGTNGILHSAKCFKMLQSVSKQHFKKGAAISAVCQKHLAELLETQELLRDMSGASRLALTVLQQHHPTLTISDRATPMLLSICLYPCLSMSIPPGTAVGIMVLQCTCDLESSHGFVNLCN